MKITKQQLKKIIKEELKKTLEEGAYNPQYVGPTGEHEPDPQAEIDRRISKTKRLGRHSTGYPIKCWPDAEGDPEDPSYRGHEAVVDGHGTLRSILKRNSNECPWEMVLAHNKNLRTPAADK